MTRVAPLYINPIYSAVLLSFVTVKMLRFPFNDLKGLIKDGSFKIGYENSTITGSFFEVYGYLNKYTVYLNKCTVYL